MNGALTAAMAVVGKNPTNSPPEVAKIGFPPRHAIASESRSCSTLPPNVTRPKPDAGSVPTRFCHVSGLGVCTELAQGQTGLG